MQQDPADHIAWLAETLASMSADIAISAVSTQPIEPAELPKIRRLLPSLAARHGLRARIATADGQVIVHFVRRERGGAPRRVGTSRRAPS